MPHAGPTVVEISRDRPSRPDHPRFSPSRDNTSTLLSRSAQSSTRFSPTLITSIIKVSTQSVHLSYPPPNGKSTFPSKPHPISCVCLTDYPRRPRFVNSPSRLTSYTLLGFLSGDCQILGQSNVVHALIVSSPVHWLVSHVFIQPLPGTTGSTSTIHQPPSHITSAKTSAPPRSHHYDHCDNHNISNAL